MVLSDLKALFWSAAAEVDPAAPLEVKWPDGVGLLRERWDW